MKLSITTSSYLKRLDGSQVTVPQCIDLIEEAGFKSIDLFFGDAPSGKVELCRDDWMEWAKALREDLNRRGLTVDQAHAPFYNTLSPDIKDREYKEEMIRRSIIAADILGVKWIVIHPGTNYIDNYLDVNIKENVEFYSRFLEVAAKQPGGIGIAIENLFDTHHVANGVTGSTEKSDRRINDYIVTQRRFGTSVVELQMLLGELKQDFSNVGACWDFGHGNDASANVVACLKRLGKDLKALHVNDNLGVYDDHLLPFLGTVPWFDVMPVLKEIGYEGVFAFETHLVTKRMPEELVKETLKFTRKIGEYLVSL